MKTYLHGVFRFRKITLLLMMLCLVASGIFIGCADTSEKNHFPDIFQQYFQIGEKAELLSGVNEEAYMESALSVTFRRSSGPTEMVLELWVRQDQQWNHSKTASLEMQDTCAFVIPPNASFAVSATVENGQGGYAEFEIVPQQGIVLDPFEHDLMTNTNTKSADPAASAWTVPAETVVQTAPTEVAEDSDWGVTIHPERVSRTGATATFSYGGSVPGQEGAELYYGDFLSLEKLEAGSWMPVEELPGYEYFVGDSSYPVVGGYGMVHEWDRRFGELPDGSYRLGKLVTLERSDGTRAEQIIYGEFSIPESILVGPIPLENLPEKYSAEQAMIDGCLVSSDGVVRHNMEAFQTFADSCGRGEPGFFRIVNWYYGDESYWIAYDLSFDGSKYTVSWLEDGMRHSETFQYLKHFTGEKEEENIAYDAYSHYVLVNDDSVQWQDIWECMISSQYGAIIDHMIVYSDFIYYPKEVTLPEELVSAELIFEDALLLTVDDSDQLEALRGLFMDGEYLGYEPKTHSVGVGLELVLTSRSGETVTIELDPDSDICRIHGEFVFYGAFDEPDYILKLWEYLDIAQWPEAVYDKCVSALRPMA